MVTEKQIAANRRNAQRSTGPKTAAGRAAIATNAVRHGLTSTATVLVPGLEDPLEWEAHREATIESLQPIGHVERLLSERVAATTWRLQRAERFEAALIQNQQELIEDDLSEHRRLFATDRLDSRGRFSPYRDETHPRDLRHRAQEAAAIQRALARLPGQPDDAAVPPREALAILRRAYDIGDVEDDVPLPGVPTDADLEDPADLAGITAGALRGCIAAVALAAGIPEPELWELLQQDVQGAREVTRWRVEVSEQELARWRRQRNLPFEPPVGELHEKLARHEAALERSLFKTLRELREMQAARQAKGWAQDMIDVAGTACE